MKGNNGGSILTEDDPLEGERPERVKQSEYQRKKETRMWGEKTYLLRDFRERQGASGGNGYLGGEKREKHPKRARQEALSTMYGGRVQ